MKKTNAVTAKFITMNHSKDYPCFHIMSGITSMMKKERIPDIKEI